MREKVDNPVPATSDSGRPMRLRPTGDALGAKVEGVDLRALDSETFAAIHRAWIDRFFSDV